MFILLLFQHQQEVAQHQEDHRHVGRIHDATVRITRPFDEETPQFQHQQEVAQHQEDHRHVGRIHDATVRITRPLMKLIVIYFPIFVLF